MFLVSLFIYCFFFLKFDEIVFQMFTTVFIYMDC